MIKFTDNDGRAVYVAAGAVIGVSQAPASSASTRSILCLTGGKLLQVREHPAEVAAEVKAAAMDARELLHWEDRWAVDGGLWTDWKQTTLETAVAALGTYPDTYEVRALFAVPVTLRQGGSKR